MSESVITSMGKILVAVGTPVYRLHREVGKVTEVNGSLVTIVINDPDAAEDIREGRNRTYTMGATLISQD